MNTSIIRYIVGYILKIEAALLLIPSIVAAIYREPEGLCYLSVSALCIFLGVLLSFRKPKNHVFYLKEGCVATSLSWIVLSFFGSWYCSKHVFNGTCHSCHTMGFKLANRNNFVCF